jgi:hypothetical protein
MNSGIWKQLNTAGRKEISHIGPTVVCSVRTDRPTDSCCQRYDHPALKAPSLLIKLQRGWKWSSSLSVYSYLYDRNYTYTFEFMLQEHVCGHMYVCVYARMHACVCIYACMHMFVCLFLALRHKMAKAWTRACRAGGVVAPNPRALYRSRSALLGVLNGWVGCTVFSWRRTPNRWITSLQNNRHLHVSHEIILCLWNLIQKCSCPECNIWSTSFTTMNWAVQYLRCCDNSGFISASGITSSSRRMT